MGQEEVTEMILETLRRPVHASLARLTLLDGRQLLVRVAGIECFGEIRSVEVIIPETGQTQLIPYSEIKNLETRR